MKINREYILYQLCNVFIETLDIECSDNTKDYLDTLKRKHNDDFEFEDKIKYKSYSTKLAQKLLDYTGRIKKFKIITDDELSDLVLIDEDDNKRYVSLNHKTIKCNPIFPVKLMKTCGLTKKSNITKEYLDKYGEIMYDTNQAFESYEKFNEIEEKEIQKTIIKPVCSLVYDTLVSKRKFSDTLFRSIYDDPGRIIIKLNPTRFTIYDTTKKLDDVTSYKITKIDHDSLQFEFSNQAIIFMQLHINGKEVKQKIPLKFKTIFSNFDDFFKIISSTTN